MAERLLIEVRERGARVVKRRIEDVGRSAKSSGGAVQLLRRALGALGGALLLRGTIATLASFSQAMSTVKAITQATEGEFKQLRATAEQLGATTRFTGTQAAEGMLFLARAGFTTSEVLVTVKDTLLLAQAGALDLGRAADIASNVLKGFNLEAADLGRVVDVLALTANSANTNVEQLGSAMSFVAPVAAAVGVSVELASAAVGALSDAGVQATRAGTGLRQIFVKLLDPTEKARKVLRGLNIATEDLNITTRGLIPVLQTLADANLTLEQAAALVGVRQAANILILTKAIPKITELSRANDNAAGTAQRVADVMDDNLNGALLRVKSAFESIILSLGREGAEGSLTGGMNRLASLLRLIAVNADILAAALAALGVVMLAQLVRIIIPALLISLQSLAASLLAISARLLPLIAGAGVAAFAILLAIAKDSGRTIQEVFQEIQEEIIDFGRGLLEPTEAVNAFEKSIGVFAREIERLGGVSELTEKQANSLVGRMKELRDEINQRLLLQQFLSPGVEGIKNMQEQIEVLDRAIKGIRATVAGEPLIPKAGQLEAIVRPTAPQVPPRLAAFLAELEQEGELLRLNNRDRTIRQALIEAEDAAGRELKVTEEGLVTNLVRQNLEFEAQRRILDEIKGPQEAFAEGMRALNKLGVEGVGSQEAFIEKTRELKLAFLDTSKDLSSGFERAMLRISSASQDAGAQIERALTNAFKAAEDALVKFVKTGKFDFTSLVDSILEDLIRMQVQQQITGPLSTVLGGIGDSLFGAPTAASGGVVGQDLGRSQLVSPSIFAGLSQFGHGGIVDGGVPVIAHRGEGIFTPAQMKAMGGGGIVNVTIINKTDAGVRTRKRQNSSGGVDLDILLDRQIARSIRGGGETSNAIAETFGSRVVLRTR